MGLGLDFTQGGAVDLYNCTRSYCTPRFSMEGNKNYGHFGTFSAVKMAELKINLLIKKISLQSLDIQW